MTALNSQNANANHGNRAYARGYECAPLGVVGNMRPREDGAPMHGQVHNREDAQGVRAYRVNVLPHAAHELRCQADACQNAADHNGAYAQHDNANAQQERHNNQRAGASFQLAAAGQLCRAFHPLERQNKVGNYSCEKRRAHELVERLARDLRQH